MSLGEKPFLAQRPVDLVGTHVVEYDFFVEGARSLKKIERPNHVCVNERSGANNTSVNVAFGSEMKDDVGLMLREQIADSLSIGDVGPTKLVVRRRCDRLQILEIRSVSETVCVDEFAIFSGAHRREQEIGANESSAARDQNLHDSELTSQREIRQPSVSGGATALCARSTPL